jgi:hypothetical protein
MRGKGLSCGMVERIKGERKIRLSQAMYGFIAQRVNELSLVRGKGFKLGEVMGKEA